MAIGVALYDADEAPARARRHRSWCDRRVRTATDESELEQPTAPAIQFRILPDYENSIHTGEKTVEGRLNVGAAAQVAVGDVVQFGATRVRIIEVTTHASFRHMLEHYGVAAALPGVATIAQGVRVYHGFRGYRQGAQEHGVVAFRLERLASESGQQGLAYEELNVQQKTFVDNLRVAVNHAFAIRDAADEIEAQRLIDEGERHKVQVLFGPPGTGKTAAFFLVIKEILQRGGRVLFAVYTAELASRVRQHFARHPCRRQITIDTCHAAFALHEDFAPIPGLMGYQLIVVDEISQLTADQNDRVLKLRDLGDSVPAFAEIGDRWQMSGFGACRAWDTVLWRQSTFKTELFAPHRCKDEAF